ncbi:tRNA (5-methylaminomethyl-2-thiouridine)(34)-methyltransferase MnmD [Leptothoe sp. PORK10 BA2]|uniref:tRNA (5-methylaminomethyl-2-thiouridine)(34)-methyltransferase MnmD n=1 Tax=Leptothoe sp. PORK10 BA2 TaxID=3110254 RepID=UPI002B2213F4|nr:MnmC family methyltransferase [Leptothoe sp. PORK10 BA2]MEA5466989.1 MnmC family methyltransferase [Leptothoe sp. PORK10 BA2]
MVDVGANGFTPEITGDGSATFYSEEFGEHFHCRHGAYTDAQRNYVDAAQIPELAQAERLAILDVCYGLGYNTAAALDTIQRVNPDCRVTIRALEINGEVVRSAIANALHHPWTPATQKILTTLATEHCYHSPTLDIQLLLGDARQTLQPLAAQGWQADAILFDPFSPTRCPQLWTVEFFTLTAQCLAPGGTLATYSCAAAVRTAMGLAGLTIGSFPGAGRHWPCTIATKDQRPLPGLSQQELEHLQTRAAIPYRDPTLRATPEAIVAQREQEQQQCTWEPTGAWRRRWLTGRAS